MDGPTRIGTVTALSAGTATVDIGASGTPVAGVPYVGARPRTGDVVLLIVDDASYAILGTIGGTPSVPCGTIVAYPVATAPDGWLVADGSAIPAEHTDLIALVGANTPDLRGRFPVGADSLHALGATGGSRFLPQHTHPGVNHQHTYSGTTEISSGSANFDPGVTALRTLNHTHGYSGTTAAAAAATGNNTGGTTVAEPPWTGLTYLIKT